jgi:hypothetical protein
MIWTGPCLKIASPSDTQRQKHHQSDQSSSINDKESGAKGVRGGGEMVLVAKHTKQPYQPEAKNSGDERTLAEQNGEKGRKTGQRTDIINSERRLTFAGGVGDSLRRDLVVVEQA